MAKRLDFRALAAMACGDDADLKEVYETEHHLLYVVCARARGRLLATSVTPVSKFRDDLKLPLTRVTALLASLPAREETRTGNFLLLQ